MKNKWESNTTLIDEIASVFYFMEDYCGRFDGSQKVMDEWCDELGHEKRPYHDYETFEEARTQFFEYVRWLDDEPWANGKHIGDCTNVPMTCYRCVVEMYRDYARGWLRWWHKPRNVPMFGNYDD